MKVKRQHWLLPCYWLKIYPRSQSIDEGLEYVATWNAAMLMGQDLQEAVTAQMQKRAAVYEDLLGQA
jgi:hypothetical protein